MLHDDNTAVNNRSRRQFGLRLVIDGEYNTRIVFLASTACTTRETLERMLETLKEAGGASPDALIQDTDITLNELGRVVYVAFRAGHQEKCQQDLGK